LKGRGRGAGGREQGTGGQGAGGRGSGGGSPGEKEVGERGWEVGEIGGKYATLHNISQSKERKEAGANKNWAGTRIKGYGKREV